MSTQRSRDCSEQEPHPGTLIRRPRSREQAISSRGTEIPADDQNGELRGQSNLQEGFSPPPLLYLPPSLSPTCLLWLRTSWTTLGRRQGWGVQTAWQSPTLHWYSGWEQKCPLMFLSPYFCGSAYEARWWVSYIKHIYKGLAGKVDQFYLCICTHCLEHKSVFSFWIVIIWTMI